MIFINKYLIIAVILSLWEMNAVAHLSLNPPKASAKAEEQHPEGIALVISLTTQKEKSDQKSFLNIYIKNTSNTVKQYIVLGFNDGIQIYYIDSQGSQIPLRKFTQQNITRTFPLSIKPEETLLVTVTLTSEEVSLLKTHQIKCKFLIFDPTTKQQFVIESSPKLLAETADTTITPSK